MTLTDLLRLVARLVHVGAASLWLGGGVIYWLSGKALKGSAGSAGSAGVVDSGSRVGSGLRGADADEPRKRWAAYSRATGTLLGRSFAALAASGAYLVFDRVSNPKLGLVYVIVLVAKVALAAGIAWTLSVGPRAGVATRAGVPVRGRARRADAGRRALWLGAGALALGVVLTLIYETAPPVP